MSLRRVLPLAFLLPLGCSGGAPAPGAGAAAAADTLAAGREPAGPPPAVDTSWPLQRAPRWGFSYRWPDAGGLTISGPPAASCAPWAEPRDSMYLEDGRSLPWADPSVRPNLSLQFTGEAALDSLLAVAGFRRSAGSPTGWVAVGRSDVTAPARFSRGGRWWALAGTVAVRGATAMDARPPAEAPAGLAVVTRPDRCRMVITLDDSLLSPVASVRVWRLLESLRFTGEDETHELRALQAFAGFDWHRRLGLIYPTLTNGACLILANGTAPEGTPVLALGRDAGPAWLTLSPPGDQCASVPRPPGDSLHLYDLSPIDTAGEAGLDGIGVLAPAHPLREDDPFTGDLDGDGLPDSVGFCSARGLYWGYLRSGSASGPILWRLGIEWPERTAPKCPSDVAS